MSQTNRNQTDDQNRDAELLQSFFHGVKLPLLRVDLSAVHEAVDATMPRRSDLAQAWIDVHPEFITRVVSLMRTVDANDAAVRLFGARARSDLLASAERVMVPESLDAFKVFVLAIAQRAPSFECEGVYRRLDDRLTQTLAMGWLPPREQANQHMIMAMVDITDLRLDNRSLATSEERYRMLLEAAGDMILRHDLEGNITFISQTGLELLGLRREEVVGRRAEELVPRHVLADTDARREARREGKNGVALYETAITTKNGRTMPLEVSSTIISDPQIGSGEPQVLLCARDITDRKRAEREQVSLDARVRTAQKLESMGALAGRVAHDFNNLLGTIMGNVELVSTMVPAGSEALARLETVLVTVEEAADLCDQMQVYAGARPLTKETRDLSEVIDRTRRLFEVTAGGTADVHFQLEVDLPAVDIDVSSIRQVVMNLVANAAHACGGQGGEVVIRTGVRNLQPGELPFAPYAGDLKSGRHVFCEVRDSGPGMDASVVARSFDPFYSTRDGGRGLGLSTAFGIVRGHGGGFLVDSEPGRGTVMTFLLPTPDVEAVTPRRPRTRRRDPSPELTDFTGRVALVVESDAKLRGVAVSFLRRLGCRALAAGDGHEALRLFGVRHGEIDAVILDLNMTGLDGLETFRRLRVIRPDVPVVFASGYSIGEMQQKTAGMDGVAYLSKPFNLHRTGAVLADVLRLSDEPDPSGD